MRPHRLVSGIGVAVGIGGLVLLGTTFRGTLPRTWSGHVVEVDPRERTLILAVTQGGGHGESITLRVAPGARIQRFDEMRKIADQAPGQLVDVSTRHTPQGGQEATTVRIRTAPNAAERQSGTACPPPQHPMNR